MLSGFTSLHIILTPQSNEIFSDKTKNLHTGIFLILLWSSQLDSNSDKTHETFSANEKQSQS